MGDNSEEVLECLKVFEADRAVMVITSGLNIDDLLYMHAGRSIRCTTKHEIYKVESFDSLEEHF